MFRSLNTAAIVIIQLCSLIFDAQNLTITNLRETGHYLNTGTHIVTPFQCKISYKISPFTFFFLFCISFYLIAFCHYFSIQDNVTTDEMVWKAQILIQDKITFQHTSTVRKSDILVAMFLKVQIF